MSELEQSFDGYDVGENPENLEPEEDTVQYNISGIPENSESEEDTIQHDISGIPENSEPEEDTVQHDISGIDENSEPEENIGQHDMSGLPENSEPEEDTVQHVISGTSENSQPDMDKVQAENDSQPKEKEEHKGTVLGGGENRWPGWPGESVFRLLVPTQKVGGIIGHKGELIKKMCEETRARIRILDGPRGYAERAVLVSAKEEPDVSVPPAIDGLLRVLKRVVDGLESDPSDTPPVVCNKVSTRFLAPATQAGSLIGKQGTTVKSIQEESGCTVRVLGAEELPDFALQDDRIIEVVGEPLGVQKAVELIASHLRKFLVDRSIIPVFEMQMQMPNHQMVPSQQTWGPPPQEFPQNTGYEPNPHFMLTPRQHDNYYSPAEMPPPTRKQQHHGISAYGKEVSATMHAPSNAQPARSIITQVKQQMQIPLSYADAVIGSAGSKISYIRRTSGATVAIQETRGVPGEMTVEISGTASQVQIAQQLIQNSMAEAAAAGSTRDDVCAPPTDQGYNPYAAPSSSAAQPGAYGSAYQANYGY